MNDLSRYDEIRPMMKTGDLLLWRSHSVLGWLIRKFSKGDVNHAGLIIRIDEFKGMTDRVWTMEALEKGIELNRLSRRLAEYNGEVWLYTLKPEFDILRPKIGRWALEKVGTPYDYGSLFKNAIGRVSADANKLFCSEYAFLAYKEAGIVSGDMAPRPADMTLLKIFDKTIKLL